MLYFGEWWIGTILSAFRVSSVFGCGFLALWKTSGWNTKMEGFSRSFLFKGLFLVGSIRVLPEVQYLDPLKFSFGGFMWSILLIKTKGQVDKHQQERHWLGLEHNFVACGRSVLHCFWRLSNGVQTQTLKKLALDNVQACEKQLVLSKSCTSWHTTQQKGVWQHPHFKCC